MRSLSLGKPLDSTLWEYTRPYRSIVPNKLSLASSLARSLGLSLVFSRARALSLRSLFYSLARSLSGAVSPDRALYLPTSSHFVIVNKTSLSPPPPNPPTPLSRRVSVSFDALAGSATCWESEVKN